MRAQVSLDAMVSIAAFIALLALLISAASYAAERTQEAGEMAAVERMDAGRMLSHAVVEADGVVFSEFLEGEGKI